ncbi:MAG TPA: PDZ domain-containing protein [Clostridiaceae bacterium]|jgi:serine protease Do|nr:PDZ domain-containing protein [Clostridiaceae bacterium]
MDNYNDNNDVNKNREDSRWSYTNSYYPSHNTYTYQSSYQQNRYQDRYDDLKTSSFYNESYKKPAKGKFKGLVAPMLIVALISSLLTGGIVGAYFTYGLPEKYSGAANPPGNTYVSENIRQIEIIDGTTTSAETVVAEKVSPSIVGISITYQYYDRFFGSAQNKGQGSGIIYSSDGYIITNNHVIENAMSGSGGNKVAPNARIEVILPNQIDHPYEATVVGRDSKTDIAILKINVSELPAAEFGDSDKIKVGQKAIAIGNPAGLEFMGSVTSGIISGLNRRIEFDDGTVLRLIQTDAAINPGNSGGALLDSEGKVIGINTSKIGGAGYEGLGFAIPSNNAVEVAESLIKSGYVTGRPQIGIVVDTRFNATIAENNGVPEGILVYEVQPLSAAFMAGVKTGDIITKFNGVDIKSFDELEREKNKYKAGDKVELTIYRIPQKGDASQGKYITLELILGEDKG